MPRRLGQHFLADRHLLDRLVDALGARPDDVVIEIGAGTGTLTEALLARGLRVVAIEKDRELARECGMRNAECGMAQRCLVVEGDALTLDWHRVVNSAFRIPHSTFCVAGNLPYYITTPLIDKALTPPLPARIVFLVQKEVADRITAAPGSRTYGALSVGVQASCRAERLFVVPPGAFRPPPKVSSAALRLTPLERPLVPPGDAAAFRRFVTACFGRRRKQLRNVLAGVTGSPPPVVAAGLQHLGIDPTARPETLPPADFVRALRWTQDL